MTQPGATARWSIAAAGFCALLNLYAPQAILPTLAREFAAGPVAVALTITATTAAVALCGPFAGALGDLFGRKRMIVVGLFGVAVPTLLSGLSHTLPQLIATRFLQGVFVPAAAAASLAYVGEEWQRAEVGRAMALYIAATIAGGFVGRFLGGVAAQLGNWHDTFYVLGVLDLAGALIVWRWLPAQHRFQRGAGPAAALRAIGGHFLNPRLMAAYAAGFTVLFGLVTTFTYVNFHLAAAPYRLQPGALGLIFCVYLVGIAITPAAGRWIDRLGQRRMLMLAAGLAAIGAVITLLPSLAGVILGLIVFCSGAFVCQAAATSYVGLVAGPSRSSAAGLYLSFFYTGGAVGSLLGGFAWTEGGWPACVALTVLVQALAAGTAGLAWREEVSP